MLHDPPGDPEARPAGMLPATQAPPAALPWRNRGAVAAEVQRAAMRSPPPRRAGRDLARRVRQSPAMGPAGTRLPEERLMSLSLLLLIVVIILLIGAVPAWPYSRGWGYAPSGILGIVLVVVLILLLTGRL